MVNAKGLAVPRGPFTEQGSGGRQLVTQAFPLQVTGLSIGGNLSLCLTVHGAALQKSFPGCRCGSAQLGLSREKCRNEGEEGAPLRDTGRRICQSGKAV